MLTVVKLHLGMWTFEAPGLLARFGVKRYWIPVVSSPYEFLMGCVGASARHRKTGTSIMEIMGPVWFVACTPGEARGSLPVVLRFNSLDHAFQLYYLSLVFSLTS